MPDEVNFEEVLVAPLEAIIRKIGASVADAQLKLDSASMEMQKQLRETNPELAKIGYISPWYQMPEINVELKMAMHYEKAEKGEKYGVFWSPFNAKYQSNFAFGAEGSSSLKLKIVSSPPPLAMTSARPIE